jgi:NAD(P)H-hydrate epimerase
MMDVQLDLKRLQNLWSQGRIDLMRTISVAQAQRFDRLAQEKYGIPSLILMENAGRSVAEEALRMLRGRKRAAIVCGAGNNGGDGLVAARHLLNAGVKVEVYLIAEAAKLKPDPRLNLSILKKMKCNIIKSEGAEKFILRFPSLIKKCDLMVDAVFGIGLRSNVRSPMSEVIDIMNKSKKPILSVDVPSGLDADTGKALGIAIKARKTVTFVASKKGFLKGDGPKYCGKIIIKDIGII